MFTRHCVGNVKVLTVKGWYNANHIYYLIVESVSFVLLLIYLP